MSMNKPSVPQGTRDFGPEVVRKRQFIFNTIREVFALYGFQPLETPAMENLETLMGKYGEEGDRLIFKILNNGLEQPAKHEQARTDFEQVLAGRNNKGITERALRYDLTIPFARYVAMHHGQLSFPFKRYQIQPVWRADRPQKGRYREFYQCDADVVGSKSLINEVELASIYHEVFTRLDIQNYQLHINSRKLLAGLAVQCGGETMLTEMTVAIDKLEKIGIEKVKEELTQRGFDAEQITWIEKYLNIAGSNQEKRDQISTLFQNNATAQEGIAEIDFLLKHCSGDVHLYFDQTLARGLNYYTGIIFEAKAPAEVKIGSIGGGGRYDNLTELFGVADMPGVGISFGVDRIYDVMEELQRFPPDVQHGTQCLFFNLGEAESMQAIQLMQKLRLKDVSCELYHEQAKFDKQFKYAERKNIAYAVIIGSEELLQGVCMLKNLSNGTQERLSQSDLLEYRF